MENPKLILIDNTLIINIDHMVDIRFIEDEFKIIVTYNNKLESTIRCYNNTNYKNIKEEIINKLNLY